MSRRNKRRNRRKFSEGEDVNPMNGLSNLSDAMLILAVGIMLALVVHWNVDISSGSNTGDAADTQVEDSQGGIDTSNAAQFKEEELQSASSDTSGSGENMERMGTVYYDSATGTYYVVDEEQ